LIEINEAVREAARISALFQREDDAMKARDVMVQHVITVGPELGVQAVANTLVQNGISALPVVERDGTLVGIVSEGDLMRRAETDTERRRSWWLDMLASTQTLAAEFAKSHARKARDVMTRKVVTATPETPLAEIANLLEKHAIKRVPIVDNGQLVGIVSRANLVQALASRVPALTGVEPSDEKLRESILATLRGKRWGLGMVNVIVQQGVVDLWGFVDTPDERKAIRIAAEATPGVVAVNDNLRVQPAVSGM
jgi:CBS domain-containing protein